MHSSIPFLTVEVVAGSVAAIITLLWGLRASAGRAGLAVREKGRVFWIGATLLIGWFFAALLASWLGLYQGASARIPTIELGLLLPIIAGVLFYRWSGVFQRVVAATPQSLLVGVQIYRVEGVVFLILLAAGSLPAVFAVPAGSGDLAVGLLAPVIAWSFTRGMAGSTWLVRLWNLLGLVDLVVAVTTGFLSSPSPIQAFAFDNPNKLITAFPLVMIPVFLVPLAVLLHLASLATLSSHAMASERAASQPLMGFRRG